MDSSEVEPSMLPTTRGKKKKPPGKAQLSQLPRTYVPYSIFFPSSFHLLSIFFPSSSFLNLEYSWHEKLEVVTCLPDRMLDIEWNHPHIDSSCDISFRCISPSLLLPSLLLSFFRSLVRSFVLSFFLSFSLSVFLSFFLSLPVYGFPFFRIPFCLSVFFSLSFILSIYSIGRALTCALGFSLACALDLFWAKT
jgi:hypothetical protein